MFEQTDAGFRDDEMDAGNAGIGIEHAQSRLRQHRTGSTGYADDNDFGFGRLQGAFSCVVAFVRQYFRGRTSECRQPLAAKSRQPARARRNWGQLVPRMFWCYMLVLCLRFPNSSVAG